MTGITQKTDAQKTDAGPKPRATPEQTAPIEGAITPPPEKKAETPSEEIGSRQKPIETVRPLKAEELVTDPKKLVIEPQPALPQPAPGTPDKERLPPQTPLPDPKEASPAPGEKKAIAPKDPPVDTSAETILRAEREALARTRQQEAPQGPLESLRQAPSPARIRETDLPPGPKLESLKEASAPATPPEQKKQPAYDRGFAQTPPEPTSTVQKKETPQEPVLTNRQAASIEDKTAPATRPEVVQTQSKAPETKAPPSSAEIENAAAKIKDIAREAPRPQAGKTNVAKTTEKPAAKAELRSPEVTVPPKNAGRVTPVAARPAPEPIRSETRNKVEKPAPEAKKVIERAKEVKAYTQRIIQRKIVRHKVTESLKDISHEVQRTISQSAGRLSPQKAVHLDKSLQKAVLEKLKQLLRSSDLTGRERALLRELKHILLAKRSSGPLRRTLGGARGEGRSTRKPPVACTVQDKVPFRSRAFRSEAKKLSPALKKDVLKVLSGARLTERQALKLLRAINSPGGLGLLASSRTDRMLRKAARVIQKMLDRQKFEELEKLKGLKTAAQNREPLLKRALKTARKSLFGDKSSPETKNGRAGLVQTIYGTVTDGETGQPVPGVLVDAGEFGAAESDENGFYEVPNVAPGSHYSIRPGLQLCTFSPVMQSGVMADTPIRHDFKLYW